MNILHIDSSALGAQSASRELSQAVVAAVVDGQPEARVVHRDLDAQPLAHLSGRTLAQSDRQDVSDGEQALEEFLAADVVVIGAPMYNFAIPSTLKAWIDRIAVAGKTFRYDEQGQAVGLCGNKRVFVASSRGGFHQDSGMDFQEPYLRAMLGFLGITDITVVRAEGLAVSEKHRAQGLARARACVAPLVAGAGGRSLDQVAVRAPAAVAA